MRKKVAQVNLEEGLPTVEAAIQRMKNALTTAKRQGYKAVILIHGYGSTGVGGKIKPAVAKVLSEHSLKGIVRTYAGGEQWIDRKREMIGMCKALENFNFKVANNAGVTVVILR
ncbi:MAG TPA: Smr/MutS family protein [Oscillospiraceae bacterium]|nr:Smr/MutS family protein [Oscillospiraceae bacterium]